MIKKFIYAACLAGALSFYGCSSDHFIKEADFRAQVETDFQAKENILSHGNLFNVFNEKLTVEETEALKFLYAYMPLTDVADYSGDFYLKNVRLSLENRKASTWGKNIPDLIFRHFVLPIRINNENMDNSREVFNKELWDRVKNLSMFDAVLEVNHWCHEKVIYTPSDSRTSSPLASVKTAYGRCGEESTFLVAALRSVGIPARQVYTPRWAHTDDNHAWVEAWVDGKWFFLGACEPEPVLNLGWFNAPASRGMLMHTKVFGAYNGPEDVMKQTANYTEINIIDNYGTSARTVVTVTDDKNRPIVDTNIEFKVYNYAEFYTVSRKNTDGKGQASLSAGLGDMLVIASHNDQFGMTRVSFGKDAEKTIVLNRKAGEVFSEAMDVIPPVEKANFPEVTPEQRAENTRRMEAEDAIRNAYVGTFPTAEKAEAFAKELGLCPSKVADFVVKSRGNHADIMQFLKNAVAKNMGERAMQLLGTLANKDLRDAPLAVLEDHLYNTPVDADVEKVLAPRIALEWLTGYRSYFQKNLPAKLAEQFKSNPQNLAKWCKDSLSVRNDLNTGSTYTTPEGTWKSRVIDQKSRDVFFVAVARSLNIPAWKDEINGNIYYLQDGKRIQVDFEATEAVIPSEGTLKLTYKAIQRLSDPKYYTHFSISKYQNGTFKLLSYPESSTWEQTFKKGTAIESGYYMLVSGSRMANGGVLSNISFFNIEEGKTTTVDLVMRDNAQDIRVIGNFNSENTYFDVEKGEETSVLNTTGRGYYIVAVLGVDQEPTNHALKDIEIKKDEFEKWGRKMILLFEDEASYKKFNPSHFPNLPSTIAYGIDTDGKIRKEIAESMKLAKGGQLPVFIIGDTFNRVVFESHGYTIGLGEQMIHIIHGL